MPVCNKTTDDPEAEKAAEEEEEEEEQEEEQETEAEARHFKSFLSVNAEDALGALRQFAKPGSVSWLEYGHALTPGPLSCGRR